MPTHLFMIHNNGVCVLDDDEHKMRDALFILRIFGVMSSAQTHLFDWR